MAHTQNKAIFHKVNIKDGITDVGSMIVRCECGRRFALLEYNIDSEQDKLYFRLCECGNVFYYCSDRIKDLLTRNTL